MTDPETANERERAGRKLKRPRRKGKTNLWKEEKAGPETRPAGLVFRFDTVLFRFVPEGVDARFRRTLSTALLTVTGLPLLTPRRAGILFLTLSCGA